MTSIKACGDPWTSSSPAGERRLAGLEEQRSNRRLQRIDLVQEGAARHGVGMVLMCEHALEARGDLHTVGVGSNRGGWTNADYDRLWAAYSVTLDRQERVRHQTEMTRIVNEELPGWPIYWDFNVLAFPTSVVGPELGIANTSTEFWAIHTWEMK